MSTSFMTVVWKWGGGIKNGPNFGVLMKKIMLWNLVMQRVKAGS